MARWCNCWRCDVGSRRFGWKNGRVRCRSSFNRSRRCPYWSRSRSWTWPVECRRRLRLSRSQNWCSILTSDPSSASLSFISFKQLDLLLHLLKSSFILAYLLDEMISIPRVQPVNKHRDLLNILIHILQRWQWRTPKLPLTRPRRPDSISFIHPLRIAPQLLLQQQEE